MSAALAQREIALSAVALLGVVAALAIASGRGEGAAGRPLPARVGDWHNAQAAESSRELEGGTTSCGYSIVPASVGVAHPVLPCGAKLYLGYGDREILTQVIARGPERGGIQFGLTDALARQLGIEGTVTVRWAFAR